MNDPYVYPLYKISVNTVKSQREYSGLQFVAVNKFMSDEKKSIHS